MSFNRPFRASRIGTYSRRTLVALLALLCAGAGARPAVAQVRAVRSGTTLTITGDANSNIVNINGPQPGAVEVVGIGTFTPVTTLKINLGEGYDEVHLKDLALTGNLAVNVGNGGSWVENNGCAYGGNVSIIAGDGFDYIQTTIFQTTAVVNQIGSSMMVDTGRDDSRLDLDFLSVGHNLTVTGGDDADTCFVGNFFVENDLLFETGGDYDNIQVYSGQVRRHVTIRSGAGGGNTYFGGSTPGFEVEVLGNVTLESGSGRADMRVRGAAIGQNLTIKTQAQGDFVVVAERTTVGNDLVIRTEAGKDEVSLANGLVVGRDIDVNTGTEDDELIVYNSVSTPFTVGRDLWLDTGSDHDHVFINADSEYGISSSYSLIEVQRDLVIKTSNGMDVVDVRLINVGQNVNIDTGTQDDDLTLINLAAGGGATVLLAGQEDCLWIENSSFAGPCTFNGGGDLDGFANVNNVFGTPPKFTNFEFGIPASPW